MADYWSNFRYRHGSASLQRFDVPSLGAIPCEYPDKLYLFRN